MEKEKQDYDFHNLSNRLFCKSSQHLKYLRRFCSLCLRLEKKDIEMKTKHIRVLDQKTVKNKLIKKLLCFGFIGSAVILLLVAYASTASKSTMARCIFCDIVAGKSSNTTIEAETEEYVIFKDIKPASTYHYLCVTKQHIESLKVMTKEDIPLGEFKVISIPRNVAKLKCL